MQQDIEGDQDQSLPISTELWRPKDVTAFVEALHSIRAKAPNGGFKTTHFREVVPILMEKVPDGIPKSTDQLSSKYQEVSCFVRPELRLFRVAC